jgi:hypothetical protein
MIVPIEKGFSIVGVEDAPSPRELFEKRAEQIAHAAELHVRRMIEAESDLLAERSVGPGSWTADPETRDAIPFGLKRRVVLRVPVFGRDGGVSDESASELRRVRGLMARLALDLIAQVIEINRYFAATGLVKAPEGVGAEGARRPPNPPGQREGEAQGAEAPDGNTMSGGSEGSSLRRRA